MDDGLKSSLLQIPRWILIAAVSGISGAVVVYLFTASLGWVSAKTPHIMPGATFILPVLGALAAGVLILRRVPSAGGEGMPSVLLAVRRGDGRLDAAGTVLKFPATLLSLGFYASGGIVGPLARMGAGTSSLLVERILRPAGLDAEETLRIAAICGVSGAVSSIFHSPLGAGIMAAEILRREDMPYTYLFPSILAGAAAFITHSMVLNGAAVFTVDAPAARMGAKALLWLPLVALAAGSVGMLFILAFESVARRLHRIPAPQPAMALVGAALVALLLAAGAGWASSTSMPFFNHITHIGEGGALLQPFLEKHITAFAALFITAKMLSTSLTVGSGMSAGFTGPLIIMGAACGTLLASAAGIAVQSPAYYGFLACGISAILGAAVNIPIAAIIITTSMFGAHYVIPALTGGILSFLVFKSRNVYEYSTRGRGILPRGIPLDGE